MTINLNNKIVFIPTFYGRCIARQWLNDGLSKNDSEINESERLNFKYDGEYYKMSIWKFAEIFGQHVDGQHDKVVIHSFNVEIVK